MSRTQYIAFELMRSKYVTPQELAMMTYISSYSNCLAGQTCKQIGIVIGRSESYVRRVLTGLEKKGLIQKKYSWYKKLVISLVSLEKQCELACLKPVKMVKNVLTSIGNFYDSHRKKHYSHTSSYSTKNTIKENNKNGIFYKIYEESDFKYTEMSDSTKSMLDSFLKR